MESNFQRSGGHLPSVLIVDDYPDAAESLCMLLQAAGYGARVVTSGLAAMAADPVPDVVITELRLPDMDGCVLAMLLQEKTGDKKPVFIAVTTLCHADDVARTAKAGFRHHFIKPVEIVSVLKALANCGRGRQP